VSRSSLFRSTVGRFQFHWDQVPKGASGSVFVEVEPGKKIQAYWKKDRHGIQVTVGDRTLSFDLAGKLDDLGSVSYEVNQRFSDRRWQGVSCNYGNTPAQTVGRAGASKAARVRAQMPGRIVRLLIRPGEQVGKDQPLLLMEAMKMENEIRSPQEGKVSKVQVAEGQAVESGADLVLIEV